MKRLNIVKSPTTVGGLPLPMGAFYGQVTCEYTFVRRKVFERHNGAKYYETVSHTVPVQVTYYCTDFRVRFDGGRPWFPLHTFDGKRWHNRPCFTPEFREIYDLILAISEKTHPHASSTWVTKRDRVRGEFPREKKAQACFDYGVKRAGYVLSKNVMTDDINAERRAFVTNTNWR